MKFILYICLVFGFIFKIVKLEEIYEGNLILYCNLIYSNYNFIYDNIRNFYHKYSNAKENICQLNSHYNNYYSKAIVNYNQEKDLNYINLGYNDMNLICSIPNSNVKLKIFLNLFCKYTGQIETNEYYDLKFKLTNYINEYYQSLNNFSIIIKIKEFDLHLFKEDSDINSDNKLKINFNFKLDIETFDNLQDNECNYPFIENKSNFQMTYSVANLDYNCNKKYHTRLLQTPGVDPQITYEEDVIIKLNHLTVDIQTGTFYQTNILVIFEPDSSDLVNPETMVDLSQISLDNFSYTVLKTMFDSNNYMIGKRCKDIPQILRNYNENFLYFRGNTPAVSDDCTNPNIPLDLYYLTFQTANTPPAKKIINSDFFNGLQWTNIKLIDFKINMNGFYSVIVLNYNNGGDNNLGLVYMDLQSKPLFSLGQTWTFLDTTSLEYTIYTKTVDFINTSNLFYFAYVKANNDGSSDIILKILDLKKSTYSYECTVVKSTNNKIVVIDNAYDNWRGLAYLVVSFDNSKTLIYILTIQTAPSTACKIVMNSPIIVNNMTTIERIKVLPFQLYNFVLIYGQGVTFKIIKVYRVFYSLTVSSFTEFSYTYVNDATVNTIYDVIINTVDGTTSSIPLVNVVIWYAIASGSQKIVRMKNCLFFTSNGSCQLGCNTSSEGEVLSNRSCVKCIVNTDDNLYLFGNTCISSCPNGYGYNIDNKCLKCPFGDNPFEYLDLNANNCIFACPRSTSMIVDSANKVCSDCFKMNKFKRFPPDPIKCVNDCDPSDIKDNLNALCYACKSNNLYYYKNSCLPSCPKYGVVSDTVTNTCIICSDYDKKVDRDQCVFSCPAGRMIKPETPECVSCQSLGYFNNFGVCDEKCKDNTGPDENNDCQECQKIKKYVFEKNCVEICPIYFVPDPQGYCVMCKSNSTYYYNDLSQIKCLSDGCPLYYVADENYICYQCHNRGYYFFNNTCVDSCPTEYAWDDKNRCMQCPPDRYNDRGTCETSCSPMTFYNKTRTCYHCDDFNKYMIIDKCVDSCPTYAAQIEFYKYCDPCHVANLSLYSSTCLKSCPPYSYIEKYNVCVRCRDLRRFFYNNTCYDECPYKTSPNYFEFNCIDSKPSSKSLCENDGVYNELKYSCDCIDDFFGKFCQYSKNQVSQVIEKFKTMLLGQSPNSDFNKIKEIFRPDYIKWMKEYMLFIEEIDGVPLQAIIDDLKEKLSKLTKFGSSNAIVISPEQFMLFDFYMEILLIKYNNYVENYLKKFSAPTSIVKSSRISINNPYIKSDNDSKYSYDRSNENNIKPKLRKLILTKDKDTNAMYKVNTTQFDQKYIKSTINTFSGLKLMLETFNENLMIKKEVKNINFTDGKNFRVSIISLNFSEINKDLPQNSTQNVVSSIDNNISQTPPNLTNLNNTNLTMINNTLTISNSLNNLTKIEKIFSSYDLNKCAKDLIKAYNITEMIPIKVTGVEFSSNVNWDSNKYNYISNSLSLKIYHPNITEKPLSICDKNPITYSIKLDKGPNFNDLIFIYQRMFTQYGINILDKYEPFFNDKCYRYKTNNSFSGLTLRQRQKYYFYNYTSKCITYQNIDIFNNDCKYVNITADYFGNCECKNFGEVMMGIFPGELEEYSKYSVDVLKCTTQVFQFPGEFFNRGFIFTFTVFMATFLIQIIFQFYNTNILDDCMDMIIHNDCITLDYDENLFPTFYEMNQNNTIKYYQFQHENTIIDQIKYDLEKSNLLKLDRLKHLNVDISKKENDKGDLSSSDVNDVNNLVKKNPGIKRSDKLYIVRKIRERYFNFNDPQRKKQTQLDLDCLDYRMKIEFDDRSHLEYYIEYLMNYNIFCYALFKKSILISQTFRLYIFCLYFLSYSFFSSFFYFEDLLEERSLVSNRQSFWFTLGFEYPRIVLAYLATTYIMILFKLFLKVPKDIYEKFNPLLWTIDDLIILRGLGILEKIMFRKRFFFVTVYLLYSLFCIFYCCNFCSVYFFALEGWLYGVSILLFLDLIVLQTFIIPFLAVFSRFLSQKHRYIILIFSFFTFFFVLMDSLTAPNKF